jgi:PAS domain S-box-containing protein
MNTKDQFSFSILPQATLFQRLVEEISDYAIYLISVTGHVNSWNAGAQRFKGYTVEEIIGQHFSRFYTDEDRAIDKPKKALQTALEKGKFEDEGWRVRKDGSRFWAHVVIDPVRDEAGELIGFAKITRDVTERKLTQEALRKSEEQFRRLVQGVTDYAIYMLSPTGIVSNWNAGAARIKQYDEREIVGQHFSRFYTDEDRAVDLPSRALQIAAKEGRFENEGWRVRKDGTRFWAQVVIDPIYDEQDVLLGFAKVTRDITEKRNAAEVKERARQAELEAKTQEYEHLARLFEQAPGFVCFFRGPDHVYEMANEAHAKLAQHRNIMGKSVREALPELKDQGFFELLDNVFNLNQSFVGRGWPLKIEQYPGGPVEERFIDFVYQPIVDSENHVVGIFSQGNDVTERVLAENEIKEKQRSLERLIVERTEALQQAEAALKQAKQLQGDKSHLLRLFDQAPAFICFLTGADHRFELANQAYYQLVGHRELIGKSVREALPEIAGQGFIELLDQVFTTGTPYIGTSVSVFLQKTPGGALIERFLDFVYQPIVETDGKVTGIFCQGNDVSEHKLAQDEIKRYQNELEILVAERTKSLEETRTALQHAQKLESIGKLTGGVAHDFNNILQVIGGNLQLLEIQMKPHESAMKRLETALGAVERGSKLSSQLLAFARRQPLQPTVVNLGRTICEMDDLLNRALGETINIETVIVASAWNTMVDPNQLENVILNLAINACDAMPDGGKLTIEIGNALLDDDYVSSKSDVPAGQYVMLAVSDTGIGMPPEILEQACEPFFTTKPEGKGTGLGLSMAYGFVKQSGGHFTIYSEVGNGTTVKMYFPRSFDQEHLVTSHASRPVASGTETILVVEDDISVQKTVIEMLSSLGYKVLKADNAESALVILQSGMPVDLLFTDVVMPGKLRSPELAKQAKFLIPSIEVLFTSGYTQNAIVHGGRLDPDVHLISKPYRREQLARKIRHLLNNRQQITLAQNGIVLQQPVEPVHATGCKALVVEDILESQELACEMLFNLGYQVTGTANAADALRALENSEIDVLVVDFNLPDMNGLELAKIAKEKYPKLKIIFASGYSEMLEQTPQFKYVVLPKPYDMDKLAEAMEMANELFNGK